VEAGTWEDRVQSGNLKGASRIRRMLSAEVWEFLEKGCSGAQYPVQPEAETVARSQGKKGGGRGIKRSREGRVEYIRWGERPG